MKLRSKNAYILVAILLLLILTFYETVYNYLFFNTNAEDLSGLDVENIKNMIVTSSLTFYNIKAKLLFYFSFILPIISILSAYDYSNIRSNYIKYNIGKNNKYNKMLKKEKLKSSMYIFLCIFIVFLIISVVSTVYGNDKEIYFPGTFLSGSLLEKLFGSNIGYIFFTGITILFSSFIIPYFVMELVDYFSFIKTSIIFILLFWVGSMLMYYFLPYYLSPMSTIMTTAYVNITIFKTILPYSIFVIIYFLVKLRLDYEVD